jgi:hypothetical protein
MISKQLGDGCSHFSPIHLERHADKAATYDKQSHASLKSLNSRKRASSAHNTGQQHA